MTTSPNLIDLAPELIENVLSFLEPHDLSSFGRTCQKANAIIRPSNQTLWRSSFLRIFDDPRVSWRRLQPTARAANQAREAEWSWYLEICRRYTAYNSIFANNSNENAHDLEALSITLIDLIETSLSVIPESTHETELKSLNLEFLDRLFDSSPRSETVIHDWRGTHDFVKIPTDGTNAPIRHFTRSMVSRQCVPEWASRLHTLYGLTVLENDSSKAKSAARGIVYAWPVTGPEADYGPFILDKSGKVNWRAVEAITSLMLRCFDGFKSPSLRVPSSFRDNIPYLTATKSERDWARVSRSWVGTYAYLDYSDLVRYNFGNRGEYRIDLADYEEACGDLMHLRLELDDSEDLKSDRRLKTALPICEDLPMLYFSGTSNGYRSGQPRIRCRGTASLVPGGRQVRWRFIISYAGADQWQLEGVQPGGIRSGGVYGLWSHCDHDENGPVGPFCYYPIELCDPTRSSYGNGGIYPEFD